MIDTDEALIDYFLTDAGVAAVHGAAFGLSPAMRISYATSDAILTKACQRIQQATAALG
jgi:aspartate aminotransferase